MKMLYCKNCRKRTLHEKSKDTVGLVLFIACATAGFGLLFLPLLSTYCKVCNTHIPFYSSDNIVHCITGSDSIKHPLENKDKRYKKTSSLWYKWG